MNQFFRMNESFDLIWFDLIKIEAFANFEWIVRIWICAIVHFVRCLNETLTVWRRWRQPCVASYFSHGLVCITLYNRISMSHPRCRYHICTCLSIYFTLLLLWYAKEEMKSVLASHARFVSARIKQFLEISSLNSGWMVESVALMYEKYKDYKISTTLTFSPKGGRTKK